MRKLLLPISFIFCFIFLVDVVFAQYWTPNWSAVSNWIGDFLGIPQELMRTDKVFRFVMLPWLAVFIAVLGIMRDIMLFRRTRNLDWILAMIIAFIVLPWTGLLGWWILFLYGAGGVISVTAVGGLILFGAVMWFIGRARAIHYTEFRARGDILKDIKHLRGERAILYQRWRDELQAGRYDNADRLRDQIAKIEGEIREKEKRV